MSLDIKRMVATLPRERQVAVVRAYRRQAKHDTTAFLYCFFLGTIGVHRLYLGQARAALPRLVMGAAFVAVLGVGIALAWPLAVVIGVPAALAVIMLGWEILDLFQIDAEVEAHNRALISRLLAEEAPGASTATDGRRSSGGGITAEDIADAQALAQEVGTGRAAGYAEVAAASPNYLDGSTPGQPIAPLAPLAGAGAWASPRRDLTDIHPEVPRAHPIADVDGGTPVYVDLTPASAAPALGELTTDLSDAHQEELGVPPIADIEGGVRQRVSVPLPAAAAPVPAAPVPAALELNPHRIRSDGRAPADGAALASRRRRGRHKTGALRGTATGERSDRRRRCGRGRGCARPADSARQRR